MKGQCFNTRQMVAYNQALIAAIRKAEPSTRPIRPISSGFSTPRPSAWHQEHCPLKGSCAADPGSGYWTNDTTKQWSEMAIAQNRGCDIWSLHAYDNVYGTGTTKYMEIASAAAAKSGAVIFVGEYGSHGPDYTGPGQECRRFPAEVLRTQVADPNILMSAVWAFGCPSHRRDMVCIWPGMPDGQKENGTEPMLELLHQANAAMSDASND